MNVIITNLSTLREHAEQYCYSSDLGAIYGTHTNDAPVIYLLTLLTKNAPDTPVRIIAVTTPEAETAYTVFEDTVAEASRALGIRLPEILPVSHVQMAATVHQIVTLIPIDSHVYIDTTGGFRHSSYLLMAVMRILEYSGIRLKKAVYSRYEPAFKGIEDVTANYRLFDLISAANSFTEFGNSRELSAFFQEHGHPEVRRVLHAMNAFSEAVALCRTAGLDEILAALNESLTALDTMQTDNENEILFQSISGMIREKFGITASGGKAEYLGVIEWCLEHQLIQQAVTIYTEKIGTYLFQSGLLKADAAAVQEILDNPNHFDLYYRLFYERFMAMPVSYASSATPLGRFLQSIREDPDAKEALASAENTAQFLQEMPAFRNRLGIAERSGLERLYRLKRAVFGADEIRRHPNTVRNELSIFPELQVIPEKCTANSPEKFINQIITNTKLHGILQGEFENPVHVYENHHINAIEYLADALKEQNAFEMHADIPQMQTIMRDYLYIKNFLRNSFNHASDKNERNTEEIAYFQSHGYPIDEMPALQDIVSVMHNAVQHCKEVKS